MDTKRINNLIKIIESGNDRLKMLKEPKIQLRVFNEKRWCSLDFVCENPAIVNMVVHQLRMEIQNEISKAKEDLKKLIK